LKNERLIIQIGYFLFLFGREPTDKIPVTESEQKGNEVSKQFSRR
jgi:hypothetical protein